jgi:uncharacterized phage-like protein YoqJ
MPYEQPLRIRQVAEAFVIEDTGGMRLAYVYYDDRRDGSRTRTLPMKAEAMEIAQRVARALTFPQPSHNS